MKPPGKNVLGSKHVHVCQRLHNLLSLHGPCQTCGNLHPCLPVWAERRQVGSAPHESFLGGDWTFCHPKFFKEQIQASCFCHCAWKEWPDGSAPQGAATQLILFRHCTLQFYNPPLWGKGWVAEWATSGPWGKWRELWLSVTCLSSSCWHHSNSQLKPGGACWA